MIHDNAAMTLRCYFAVNVRDILSNPDRKRYPERFKFQHSDFGTKQKTCPPSRLLDLNYASMPLFRSSKMRWLVALLKAPAASRSE